MVLPFSTLNFPLVIFTIFFRRVIDKVTRMPKDAVLKKSVWYTLYMLAQNQWPRLVAGIALTCSIWQFYGSKASTPIASMVKNNARILNNSIRHKRWLERRRSWLKEFHNRKTKEAHMEIPLKSDVGNLTSCMRDHQMQKGAYRGNLSVAPEMRPRLTLPQNSSTVNVSFKHDKYTYTGPPASIDRFSQTEGDDLMAQMQSLGKSFSQISIVTSTNDSPCSSVTELPRNNEPPSLWHRETIHKNLDSTNFENVESQRNNNSFEEEKEETPKYMDHMCEILPIGSVNFAQSQFSGHDNKFEDNKFENNEFVENNFDHIKFEDTKPEGENIPYKPQSIRKRRPRKLRFSVRRKSTCNKFPSQCKAISSDSHLIRKTRSGRIYGYSSGNNLRGKK